jgi:hypothetical protein
MCPHYSKLEKLNSYFQVSLAARGCSCDLLLTNEMFQGIFREFLEDIVFLIESMEFLVLSLDIFQPP